MSKVFKINWKHLIVSIAISLGIGTLSGLFTMGSMDDFAKINKPPLSPPGFLFPIVWTILFILMGISSYIIFESNSPNKNSALTIYAVQLALNFLWPILFFNLEAYLLSFILIIVLWIMIIVMIVSFYKIDKVAAYLMIPYLLWVTFAAYLNFGIFLLN